jgi:NAD(P)H-hydrate epimerase
MGFLKTPGAKPELKPAVLPPLVFDADGLKLLAKLPNWPKLLPAPAILTPHPGEMSVLTGLSAEEIQKDRLEIAKKFAAQWGHVVVLKGAFTVIAAPDGRTTTIPVATPALARAGTGDVLAGLIVGLRAQGMEAYEAAVAGAWIHAQAGLTAAEVQGSSAAVLAGDVLDAIADVMSAFE